MEGKMVIFDFDGTLCDSFDAAYTAMQKVIIRRGFRMVSKEEFKTLSKQECIRRAGIGPFSLGLFLRDTRIFMEEHVKSLHLFPGISQVLELLRERGYKIIVLSSNSHENIEQVLTQESVGHFIDEIYAPSPFFFKHRLIRRIMKKYHERYEDVFMIGDEQRDVCAANKAGIRFVGVSWGYEGREPLIKAGARFIVDSPLEILDKVKAS